MKSLFIEMRKYSRIRKVSKRKMQYYLKLLDADEDQKISFDDFSRLEEVLAVKIYSKGRPPFHKKFPCFFKSKFGQGFVNFFSSNSFDYVGTTLLAVNLVFAALETGVLVSNDKTLDLKWLAWLELAFAVMYMVEMLLKMLASGFTRYWRKLSNKFDGAITILNFLLEVIYFNAEEARNVNVARVLMLIRLLRLFGFLTHFSKFATIFTIYGSLINIFGRVIGVLIGVYYFFSYVGIQLYGGLIFYGNVDLSGSLFESANYYCYNFNDCKNLRLFFH